MLDPQLFKQEAGQLVQKLLERGYQLDLERYQFLEDQRRSLQAETEALQAERNRFSKQIGIAKSRGEDVQPILDSVANLGNDLKQKQERLGEIQSNLNDLYSEIPNIPHSSVPVGADENDNVEVRRWGIPGEYDFMVKDHVDLGENLGFMDYESASKLAGSRFVVLKGQLAMLHRALAQFMLNLHVMEHGYTEINVPLLVNAQTLYGTGQLPKFEDDQFSTVGEPGYYLIPTAEVPLTNMVSGQIVEDDSLPMRMVAHSACFRKEAGSYGRDTRGMIRQHQFEKVGMVHVVRPSESYDALEYTSASR